MECKRGLAQLVIFLGGGLGDVRFDPRLTAFVIDNGRLPTNAERVKTLDAFLATEDAR